VWESAGFLITGLYERWLMFTDIYSFHKYMQSATDRFYTYGQEKRVQLQECFYPGKILTFQSPKVIKRDLGTRSV